MSRTNVAVPRPPARNHEGVAVRRVSASQELRRTVLAHMLWEGEFYESGEDIAGRLVSLVSDADPAEVAALAVEAREQMKLRHVPLWLARLLAGRGYNVASLLERIVQRPDELAEFVSIYWQPGKRPLAASVKRGLAAAFRKFSAYALAKYDRPGAIRLRDVLFLTHAKPKDETQAAVWKRLVDGTLPTPDTWETELSAGKDKRETFERLIVEKKLGALAVLRNLRNMEQAKVGRGIIKLALAEMDVSRVLPFRFIAAARYAPTLEPDLEAAMFRALEGAPRLPGRTAIVVDTSPSMWQAKISAKSEMDRFEAAAALAILCREVCDDVRVYAFNSKAYAIPARRGFALRDALAATQAGYSRGGLAVAQANADGYDRIVVITDGQWHVSAGGDFGDDAVKVSPRPLTNKAYMVNVASYKNGVGYGPWTQIDGWSEAILGYIAAAEGLSTFEPSAD